MKTIILVLFTSILSAQTIDYDKIDYRPELLSKKDFQKEIIKNIIITDESITKIEISFCVNINGYVFDINTNLKDHDLNEHIKKIILDLGKWTTPEDEGKPVNCKIKFNIIVR